jgi:hypothetical protein
MLRSGLVPAHPGVAPRQPGARRRRRRALSRRLGSGGSTRFRRPHRTAVEATRSGNAGKEGGQGRGRTADLPIFSRTLVPTELPGRGYAPDHGARVHLTGAVPGRRNRRSRQSMALTGSVTPPGAPYADGRSRSHRPPSSSGLGRRPFTAVARVRIPLGVPATQPAVPSQHKARSSPRQEGRFDGAEWAAQRPGLASWSSSPSIWKASLATSSLTPFGSSRSASAT